jgi:hypothetical protein
MTVAVGRNDDNKKLKRVISTKLSIEDHKTFRILTDLTYQYGGIKEDTKTILKVCFDRLWRHGSRIIYFQEHNRIPWWKNMG